MQHNDDAIPPKTNDKPDFVTPFGTNSTSQPSPINDNGGSPMSKNDDILFQAPAASIASESRDDRPIPSQSDRQSASQSETIPGNPSSAVALGASKLKDTDLSRNMGNDPPTKSNKMSKNKIGSMFSSVKAKLADHPSKSDAKALPPHTIVDGGPSAIPSEPSDTSQLSPINSNNVSLGAMIDDALSHAPAPSTASRPYKTKDDDNNHAQPDQSAAQGGTRPDTPSSTGAGASKGFSPKSFIRNHTKVKDGIDPSGSNADKDPPTKTENASILSRLTPKNFKSKRADDPSKDEANAVPCTTVDEDRTKPNTGANEDPSATPFASSIPKVNVNSDFHAKIDDLHTKRDENPSQATDSAKGDDVPKPDDERDQQNPEANSAPTTGDEAKANEVDLKLGASSQVLDDDDSVSSETDSDDDPSDGNPDPAQSPPNIIVFGETGVGKSSLIRMLGGDSKKQPEVSGDAAGCTTDTAYYSITIIKGKKEVKYRVWDTPGLSEGGKGTVPTLDAFQRIHDRVQKLEGVNLLVYCIRAAEYTDIVQVNYDLVAKVVCGGKVPVVAVVSWLENEDNMESWWKENKGHLKKMIKLKGHACVTTTKGKKDGDKFVFQQEYDDSKKRVQKLIKKRRLSKGIKPDPIADLKDEFQKYMDGHNSGDEQNRKMAGRLMQLFTK